MIQLCAPSLIYLIFSVTQIIIDTFKGLYNTAFFKLIVSIIITLLLNALCSQGLDIISWIIVFVPFILMTVIVSMLLYAFGLDIATGSIYKKNQNHKEVKAVTVSSPQNQLFPNIYKSHPHSLEMYKYPNINYYGENNSNTNNPPPPPPPPTNNPNPSPPPPPSTNNPNPSPPPPPPTNNPNPSPHHNKPPPSTK